LPMRAEQARLLAPQAAARHLRPGKVLMMGSALWNRPELLKEGTEFLKGALFCDLSPTAMETFAARYREAWGQEPNLPLAMLTHDSVAALAQGMREQRRGGVEWRRQLIRPGGFQGAAGPFTFQNDGRSRRECPLLQVREEGIAPLGP
ncbi:MAG: ABC transporter substrate-binding protein, partial [Magnetococcales bacterium]|nr:ABC transporter substrate-binding protein [Magnetococcales bacterium]